MYKTIQEIGKKYGLILDINYDENNDYNVVLSIFNSSKLKVEDYDLNDENILVIIGLYYLKVKKNNEYAKKYYLMAIEKGNANAMNNLGVLYIDERDYKNGIKYYLMAIEKENNEAIKNIKMVINDLELYVCLKNMTIKNELIENEIKRIENNNQI
uniref:Uncharacterized protein n=1 Tax=viral metagenome TaxID=1070528 RepID=A0A6C0H5R6_9ZZZZ